MAEMELELRSINKSSLQTRFRKLVTEQACWKDRLRVEADGMLRNRGWGSRLDALSQDLSSVANATQPKSIVDEMVKEAVKMVVSERKQS